MTPDFDPDAPPILVRADTLAGRLLPAYLERRAKDLDVIGQELARGGFRAIERLGHNYKGVGRSYGLNGISEIGAVLEQAGQEHDEPTIRALARALASYLRRVRIVP